MSRRCHKRTEGLKDTFSLNFALGRAQVGRGVLTAPPNDDGVRVADGGVRTPRPTHPAFRPTTASGQLLRSICGGKVVKNRQVNVSVCNLGQLRVESTSGGLGNGPEMTEIPPFRLGGTQSLQGIPRPRQGGNGSLQGGIRSLHGGVQSLQGVPQPRQGGTRPRLGVPQSRQGFLRPRRGVLEPRHGIDGPFPGRQTTRPTRTPGGRGGLNLNPLVNAF